MIMYQISYSDDKSTLNLSNSNSIYLTLVSQEEIYKIIQSLKNSRLLHMAMTNYHQNFSRLALLK